MQVDQPKGEAKILDSGKRQEFATGSKRDVRDGKGRYDLLMFHVMYADARHLEEGAKKYGDANWRKGQPLSRYLDSAVRHIAKFAAGERGEPHLCAARWNLGAIYETKRMISNGMLPVELDDIPDFNEYSLGKEVLCTE